MIIDSFRIFRYQLPLVKPLLIGKEKIILREGLVLRIVFNNLSYGFGEIAPLPGLSRFGIDKCLENLKEVCNFILGKNISCDGDPFESNFFSTLGEIKMYSAVSFGVEMAILNALAFGRGLSLSKFLSSDAVDRVSLNALISLSDVSLASRVETIIEKGYKLIKVKVGGSNIQEDIERLRLVLDVSNGRAQIHLDANRKWSFDRAVLFCEKFSGCGIKYIEEPFSAGDKIADFFHKTGIPVALDESLLSERFDLNSLQQGVRFLVIKPTLLGGIRKAALIMRDAQRKGIQCIVSSSFESGVGLLTLGHLASNFGDDVSAGLDTLQYFVRDLLINLPVVSGGKLTLPEANILDKNIRFEYLNQVV